MGVTVSDLITAYGANYIDAGQSTQRLLKKMALRPRTAQIATPRLIRDTQWRLSEAAMSRIVQPFQKQFTELGDLTLAPKIIQLYHMKTDLSVYPDDIAESWAGFLADLEDNERENWPLIRYIMEVHYAEKIGDDLERNEYFKGVAANPTPGSAGAVSTSMNGLKKLVDDGIAAGDINQVLLDATPDASNMFDSVEQFVDGIDEEAQNEPMVLCMSTQNRTKYFRDKRNTHGGDTNYDDSRAMTVDGFPNITIEGLPSMAGSDYIFATPRTNFFHLRRQQGMKQPELQPSDRQVKILSDWWEGIGFGVDGLVWAYDGTNVV